MAYRAPRFMPHHSAQHDLASLGGSAVASGYERAWVADGIAGVLFRWDGSSGDQFLEWDGGASAPDRDRLIIPAGHNLDGQDLQVRGSATPITASTDGTLRHSFTAAAGLIDESVAALSDRYVGLVAPSVAAQLELGEVFLTQIRAPAVGPAPGWSQTPIPNRFDTALRSGAIQSSVLGPARTRWRFEYHDVGGTDYTLFQDLLAETRHGADPFYFDPPTDDGAPDPPVFVKLTDYDEVQDFGKGLEGLGPFYRVTLELTEMV